MATRAPAASRLSRGQLRVFILEDSRSRRAELGRVLGDAQLTVAVSFGDAVARFQPPYDALCLDHDLGSPERDHTGVANNGFSFVRWLPEASDGFQPLIFVHTASPMAGQAMGRELLAKGFDPRVMPFGQAMLAALCEALRGRTRT